MNLHSYNPGRRVMERANGAGAPTYAELVQEYRSAEYEANPPSFEQVNYRHHGGASLQFTDTILVVVYDLAHQEIAHATGGTLELVTSSEELVGKGMDAVYNLMNADDVAPVQRIQYDAYQNIYRIAAKERSSCKISFACRMHTLQCETLWVLHQTMPYYLDNKGNPLYMLSLLTDISPYQQANRVAGQFTYTNSKGKVESLRLPSTSGAPSLFTQREQDIIQRLVEGQSSKQIAVSLQISTFTVNNHRKRLLRKTGSKNSAELAHFALDNQLIF